MATSSSNRLLRRLEGGALATLAAKGQRVELSKSALLQEVGEDVSHVYFPETAVLAVAVETLAGESVNVVQIGSEGVFGAFEACGSRQSFAAVTVQLGGLAWRTPASAYRDLFDSSASLRNAIHKYVEVLLVEARQFVACNALHTVENRLARTLLDTYDRAGAERLPLTQDAISHLLGVQRTTVAASIGALQRDGLVRTRRGSVELLDIHGLEEAACSCRQTLAYARGEIQGSRGQVCDA